MRRIPAVLVAVGLLAGCGGGGGSGGIDTISEWDGISFMSDFGIPDTQTYGQVITVPSLARPMTGFTFEIGHCTASVQIWGYVYAWDGSKATGTSLFTSDPVTVDASSTFEEVSFHTGSLALPTGEYVIFASSSDPMAMLPDSACEFGAFTDDTHYKGGTFVYVNNGSDRSLWTSGAWDAEGVDLAFRVGGVVP